MMDKKGLELLQIGKWVIGSAILVILFIFLASLSKGRFSAAIQGILGIFRFGK
jgi:hypothetical protein